MVVNQLEKSIWKETILDNFLTYMLREKKLKSNKKWLWYGHNKPHHKYTHTHTHKMKRIVI
jgi:hypothetical protein